MVIKERWGWEGSGEREGRACYRTGPDPANLPPLSKLCLVRVFEDNRRGNSDRQEELVSKRQDQAVFLTQAYLKPAKN